MRGRAGIETAGGVLSISRMSRVGDLRPRLLSKDEARRIAANIAKLGLGD
jgi:hypothetical protein